MVPYKNIPPELCGWVNMTVLKVKKKSAHLSLQVGKYCGRVQLPLEQVRGPVFGVLDWPMFFFFNLIYLCLCLVPQ